MKFSVEVEGGWLDEDDSIDSAVREAIIQGIVNRLSEDNHTDIGKTVEKRMTALMGHAETQVDDLVEKEFKKMMCTEIIQTDDYGRQKARYSGIEQMIKEKFDNYLTQKVSGSDGTTANSYSSNKMTRFEFIVKNRLEKMSREFTQDAIKKVTTELKKKLSDDLTNAIGKEITELLNVDKLMDKVLTKHK